MDGSKFNPAWLQPLLHPEFQPWLQEASNDPKSAFCNVCKKKFALSNMGKRAVTSHMSGQTHQARVAATKSTAGILAFLRPAPKEASLSATATVAAMPVAELKSVAVASPSTATSVLATFMDSTHSTSAASASSSSATASSAGDNAPFSKLGFLPDNDIRAAELTWVLHVISTKASFRAQDGISNIFKKMFKDSRIAAGMTLSRTKTSYLACYGLAPYFHHKLADDLRQAPHVVVCFDESLNRISKLQQMDLAVRFWDEKKNEVTTRFWNSSFLGHSSASDLLRGFKDGLGEDIKLEKLVQVSMDGPNVNWAFLGLLIKDMKTCEEDPVLIDTGSCGLHVVHGAFQAAFSKTGWEIDKFLKSVYNVFKDSPARRADFVSETKCKDFPLKFCNCRWLENVPVCDRAIKILPHLKTYFKNKGAQLPNTYSVNKTTEILKDKLLLPKLHFFLTIASMFEPFLREFQAPKPMFPFLHSATEDLVRGLMERFVKSSVLEDANTAYKLIKIDLSDVDNTLKLRQVNIGPAAGQALDVARVKDVDADKYRLEAKNCLLKVTEKLVERSPLKYKFVKLSSCLDPQKLLTRPEKCKIDFQSCVGMLLANGHVTALHSDRAILQFGRFALRADKSELSKFDRTGCRLDTFYVKQMNGREEFEDAWRIIKIILIFSHGNAFVEGGFSINKQMLVENLHEESLVALRRAWDGLRDAGGENAIAVDQEMIRYARGASAKYKEAIEERRKRESELERLSRYQKEEKKRKTEQLQKLEKEKEELMAKQSNLDAQIKKLKKK